MNEKKSAAFISSGLGVHAHDTNGEIVSSILFKLSILLKPSMIKSSFETYLKRLLMLLISRTVFEKGVLKFPNLSVPEAFLESNQ